MYNPYFGGPEWEQPQMPFGFNNENPADFSAMPTSPPFTMPPCGGGTSRMFSEPKEYKQTYELDATSYIWYSAQYVNGLLRKRTPLMHGLTIQLIVDIVDHHGNLLYVAIQYFTDAAYTVVLSAEDFSTGRFVQNMNNITRLPGCTKRQANDLFEFLLRNAPKLRITLYPHQGFIEQPDGSVVFAANPDVQQMPEHIIPKSLRIRSLSPLPNDLTVENRLWLAVKALPQQIRLLLMVRIGSLLRYYLKKANIGPNTFLILTPSLSVSEELLYALMSTNNIRLHPIPMLDENIKDLTNELCLVWDGIAVFADRTLADEGAKREETLRFLIREAAGDTGHGRNSIVLISPYAAYDANRIASDHVLSVSMDGVTLDTDSATIAQMVSTVDSIVINRMLNAPDHAKSAFIEKCKALPPYWGKFFGSPLSDLAPFLMSAEYFLRDFCDLSLLSDDELIEQLTAVYHASRSAISADQLMIQDFASVLCKKIRTGEIAALQKQQRVQIDPERDILLIDGDDFYIRGELIDSILRSTQTVHTRNSLLAALRQSNLMHSTDGNTKPIQVYDLNGKSQRLYWYCMDASILDADVLHLIRNLDSEQFWLAPDEVPERDFVPLLRDESGRVAGRIIRQQDAENSHTYVTGQSGAGKTYVDCQLMAKMLSLDHHAIVFDNSDSTTYEAMCRNLSKKYVDENVAFIDIDADGIPVDLFRIDRNAKKPTQKKVLRGILTAGVGELSAPQRNRLSSVLSDMLDLIDKSEPIRPCDILAMLQEDGATYESLRGRLEPLLEDIDALGMVAQSWGEVFQRNVGKIIVIRTASGSAEHGDQLIDMQLASLVAYRKDNPGAPLDIFVDELQNQNLSSDSIIYRIMKEGRKYGITFIGTTQDFYPSNTELGKIMGKADTQIILRPTPNSANAVATALRFKKGEAERFDTMQRGDAIIKTCFYSKAEKRNIPATLSGRLVSFIENDADASQID